MTLVERISDFKKLIAPLSYIEKPFLVEGLTDDGFFTAPASAKNHGNYEGGLYDHSANVARVLLKLTEDNKLLWSRPESPLIVGMFHDLCKCDEYRHPYMETPLRMNGEKRYFPDEKAWVHSSDTLLKGHGDKSVMLLSRYFTLTNEEIACIRYHMGAFTERTEWGSYTRAIHTYANVLWTHQADMIAAHLIEVAKE